MVDVHTTRVGEKYAICISFYELYQDRIYDLLDDQQSFIQKRKHLLLKRDVSTGRRFVSGLRKIYVDTAEVPNLQDKQFLLTIGSILGPEQGNFGQTKQ
jgi:Kinesin motor domain